VDPAHRGLSIALAADDKDQPERFTLAVLRLAVRTFCTPSRRPAEAGREEARPAAPDGAGGLAHLTQILAPCVNQPSGEPVTAWRVETAVDVGHLVPAPATNAGSTSSTTTDESGLSTGSPSPTTPDQGQSGLGAVPGVLVTGRRSG